LSRTVFDDDVGATLEQFAHFGDALPVFGLGSLVGAAFIFVKEGEVLLVDPDAETEIKVHRDGVTVHNADEFGTEDIVGLGRFFGTEEGRDKEGAEEKAKKRSHEGEG